MKIYAISDLHLSNACDKPMDIFGGHWENHEQKIAENWKAKISDDDLVLIPGDISWGMKLEEAKADLLWIDKLPGKKIRIKGNHEYWWKSISAVREILPSSMLAIQNDAVKIGRFVICGTRGWTVPEKTRPLSDEDLKIYKREVERCKLTLSAAKKLMEDGDTLICMIHFPPFGSDRQATDFCNLFAEFGASKVVFGHIHGRTNCPQYYEIDGVKYYFVSCDHINNNPVLLFDDEN